MAPADRLLLSGNEAVALAAYHAGFALGAGYPGTPATDILEAFAARGGRAEWAPNEKVALEVAIGAAFAGARALAAMKHVGLNVAADPFFSALYAGVTGALVVVSADDPNMWSSQSEQDNRRYAAAAGAPLFEPADSQEAYDMTAAAVEVSERWGLPVMLRLTTRVCHSKSVVRPRALPPPPAPHFERDIPGRVMIPSHARPAHRRLRKKLAEIQEWNEASALHVERPGAGEPGVVASGVAALHVMEAAADAPVLKLAMTHPLPVRRVREFARRAGRVIAVEEGDPFLADALRAEGVWVERPDAAYRFGELNVSRARRLLAGEPDPPPAAEAGPGPHLCPGCPHGPVFETLRELDCIVAGDIGCYTLAALPPYEAMDSQLCMGASIGMGLGLRHALPPDQARRVVSVIGDSTFIHSGVTGLIEMVYNPPATGHVVVILDNDTTAMTGLQGHPGSGRRLDGSAGRAVSIEALAETIGVDQALVIDPVSERERFKAALRDALASDALTVIVARRPCLLLERKRRRAAGGAHG